MSTQVATVGTIEKQISLPLTEAIKIAFRSLKIRFWRSLITIGGIFFGIAFLMSILTSTAINGALLEGGSAQVRALLEQKGTDAEAGVQQIWLVTLSLLVCAVGITNAMLMSVTERYREIGTMKCLGALDKFIVELFLLESAFQGLVGSLGGVILGCLFMLLSSMSSYGTEPISVFPLYSVLEYGAYSLGAGLFLSVIGAMYPAYRAAKMPPADAMRTEV
ncbi:MAG: ABC transporter permease [Candidatus Latescibacteria bacterium]|jgi:putative ABC transport system permease protein|nr:ABC transporter permease [Candidatus Latescibacterota bacterium]